MSLADRVHTDPGWIFRRLVVAAAALGALGFVLDPR